MLSYIASFCRGFADYIRCRDLAALTCNRGWRHGRAVAHFISGGY